MDLVGRHVLVTGASRGIGRALAEQFAAAGSRVALVARGAQALDEVARAVDGAAYSADLADPASVAGLVARIEAADGPLDVLVNNAGVETAGHLLDPTSHEVEQLYRLNLLTPVELCRQVLPGMLSRRRGQLVAMSSLAGVAMFPGLAAYGSSKAGLTHFTAGLRADVRGSGVGTTVVEIGPVTTDMMERARRYAPTRRAFERMYRLGLLVEISPHQVAEATVEAVRNGRRHVRLPRRAAASAALTEAPRRATELLLTGLAHQDRR